MKKALASVLHAPLKRGWNAWQSLLEAQAAKRDLAKKAVMRTTPQGKAFFTWAEQMRALLPLTAKDDLELVQALEMHLRQEAPPLSGRDQLFFRSAYFPVKGVVDGDFCASYNGLPADEQRAIADELDRSPPEISKKLEELANRIM